MEDFLRKNADESGKCIQCGACQAVCPVYGETLDESRVARGRMALMEAVLQGDLPLSDRLNEILTSCIGCKACATSCPSGAGADFVNLVGKLHFAGAKGLPFYQKLLSRQIFLNPQVMAASARLLDLLGRRLYTPLADLRLAHPFLPFIRDGKGRIVPRRELGARRERAPSCLPEGPIRGRVALFLGCGVELLYPQSAEAAIETLTARGIEVIVPPEQACCGAPSLHMGDADTARKLADRNQDALSDPDVDAVVTLCATCGYTLKELTPRLFGSASAAALSAKIHDLQAFLRQCPMPVEQAAPVPEGSPLRVTYHEPCHLGRGMGVGDASREMLQSLPGIEYVEMRDADRCCGGGGLFSLSHYDLALKIGRHKVERIRESDAQIVATACPACQIQLTDLLNRAQLAIPVVHVVELSREIPRLEMPTKDATGEG